MGKPIGNMVPKHQQQQQQRQQPQHQHQLIRPQPPPHIQRPLLQPHLLPQQQPLQQQPLQQQQLQHQQQATNLSIAVAPVLQIGHVNTMQFTGTTPALAPSAFDGGTSVAGGGAAVGGGQPAATFLSMPAQTYAASAIIGQLSPPYQQLTTGAVSPCFSSQPLVANTVLMPVMKQVPHVMRGAVGVGAVGAGAVGVGAGAVRHIRPKPASVQRRQQVLTIAGHLAAAHGDVRLANRRFMNPASRTKSRHISSMLAPSILSVPRVPLRAAARPTGPHAMRSIAPRPVHAVQPLHTQVAPINLVVNHGAPPVVTAVCPLFSATQYVAADLSMKSCTAAAVTAARPSLPLTTPTAALSNVTAHTGRSEQQRASCTNSTGTGNSDMHGSAPVNLQVGAYERSPKTEGPTETAEYEDFCWEEYLEDNNAIAAPPTTFKHVECSVQSGFEKSMKLEVKNKTDGGDTYWLASILMSCGQLLRLRYDGYDEDASADFWCDVASSDIHPVGWCALHNKSLQPPEEIKHKRSRWDDFLTDVLRNCKTAPAYLLDGHMGSTPLEQLKAGMRLELQHELEPQLLWIVCVLRSVGGRLLLRYEGVPDDAAKNFWLFYLHPRLHPIGWATQHGRIYRPPAVMLESQKSRIAWIELLNGAMTEANKMPLSPDIFKAQLTVPEHHAQLGWRLELLHPAVRTVICPGTVTEIVDEHYFIVTVDRVDDAATATTAAAAAKRCCHCRCHAIFPVGWCTENGLKLTEPEGWSGEVFDWADYLKETSAEAAPKSLFDTDVRDDHEFEVGMRLEAVSRSRPSDVCAATVTRVVGPLLWLRLDHAAVHDDVFIDDVRSHDIFPVGWCDSNDYPFAPPVIGVRRQRVAVVQPEVNVDIKKDSSYTKLKDGTDGNDSICPKIYINHRCFSGPFLSKGRIAELPRCVGPGPVPLVMREVLSMLISVAYKSSRVLRELQVDGSSNPDMQRTVVKAKYKGKSYRALVEICRTRSQTVEFCRRVCLKLECCQHLFSPLYVNGSCPEKCHKLTKTKYTHYYGKKKKRKIGRPPGGHTNLENGEGKPGQRRKRRKLILTHRKKGFNAGARCGDSDGAWGDNRGTNAAEKRESDGGAAPAQKKRKYMHRTLPPTEIRTRWARRPKFTFERRTHQKILLGLAKKTSPKPARHAKPAQKRSAFQPVKQEDILHLKTNPLTWSVRKVINFMKATDCANLSKIFQEQEIDGQALLLLTLPSVQEYLELKLGPAVKLCHQVERLKIAFFEQFV